MSLYNTEEKISKIAESVAADFRGGTSELDDLVGNARKDYMLSNPEVEVLAAKVNHLVFKEKFAEDKLSTFKIAKYENILKVDRTMNIVEYKVASYVDPGMEKSAEEDRPGVQNIEDVKLTPMTAPLLADAGEENVNSIRNLNAEHDREIDVIKNRVKALIKEGEPLDNIYAVLRDTWGFENEEELKIFFDRLVAMLKADGYLKDTEYEPKSQSIDVDDKEPLKQASLKLLKIAEQLPLRESAHELIMRKLASEGYEIMARQLENKMPGDYYSVERDLYHGVADMKKTAAMAGKINVQDALGSALLGSVVLGGSLKLLDVASSTVDSIRQGLWEGKLKRRYPELNQIPEDRYRDIYRSIVGLEPELLKAPYALKEMIKAHDQYGTMDTKTIIKLLETGRKGHETTRLVASNMSKGLAMNPGYTLGD